MTMRIFLALARVLCVCIVSAANSAATPRVTAARAASLEASPQSSAHFANADDPVKVVAGKLIYAQRCSSCHGKRLQGQPLWQLQDQYSGRRAPAHDESGHTWEHSDEELFHIIRYGRFATTPSRVPSYMPAFEDILNDEQILDVMAFIKARWPLGLRISQSLLNPNYAGMPANAQTADWTFPPTCLTSIQRWRMESAPEVGRQTQKKY
jgi:mono/diheme cytochrome c family protein